MGQLRRMRNGGEGEKDVKGSASFFSFMATYTMIHVPYIIGGLYPPPTFHMDSMWNPYHSRWIPPIPYGICFGWDPSHVGDSIPPGIHIIPCGFHAYSMEWPFGIHLELWYRFHNHFTWIPYGFHPIWKSTWIPHGLWHFLILEYI